MRHWASALVLLPVIVLLFLLFGIRRDPPSERRTAAEIGAGIAIFSAILAFSLDALRYHATSHPATQWLLVAASGAGLIGMFRRQLQQRET